MSTSLLYHGWGVRGYRQTGIAFEEGTVRFVVEQCPDTFRCNHCGSRDVMKSGQVPRRLRSLPIGGKPVWIELPVQRLWCAACGKIRQAKVGFADERRGYTHAFERYALELSRHMTIKDVARHLGVGWDTVKDIQKRSLAPLDRQLYLPEEWARDADRRKKCHVPPGVEFREKWRIGLDLIDRCRGEMPHGWTAADDEFGRCIQFRRELRDRKERYVLDVPGNTLVRDLEARRPRRKRAGKGRKRKVPFVGAGRWAAKQPDSRWQRITVRAGRKGPLAVDAMTTRVVTKDKAHRTGAEERLVVIRPAGNKSEVSYALSNAGAQVPLAELVRVKCQRHRIEEMFEEGKGEAGLGHYEVRSWVGWHHHMTLALLALWFGKEKLPRRHRPTGPRDILSSVA